MNLLAPAVFIHRTEGSLRLRDKYHDAQWMPEITHIVKPYVYWYFPIHITMISLIFELAAIRD
jgi:hypothetical protein